jgi:hypothetical protein
LLYRVIVTPSYPYSNGVLMNDIHARPPILLFMKAVTKKQIWIPGYTKRDGTPVAGHMHWVNVSVDHDEHKAVAGKGNYTEQQAHKKLSKKDWFNAMPHDHKVAHILKEATAIQTAASIASRSNAFKKNILAGVAPKGSEVKAFHALPDGKKQDWVAEFKAAGKEPFFAEHYGKWMASASKDAPQAAPEAAPKVVAAKEEPKAAEPAHKPLDHGELNIPGKTNSINAQLDAHKKAEATASQKAAKQKAAENKADKTKAKELFAAHEKGRKEHAGFVGEVGAEEVH